MPRPSDLSDTMVAVIDELDVAPGGFLPRAELMERLDLTKAHAGSTVKGLVARGIVTERNRIVELTEAGRQEVPIAAVEAALAEGAYGMAPMGVAELADRLYPHRTNGARGVEHLRILRALLVLERRGRARGRELGDGRPNPGDVVGVARGYWVEHVPAVMA